MMARDHDRSSDTPLPAATTFADGPSDLDAPGWTWLIAGAAIVGLLVGALGTVFRSCLDLAEHGRNAFIAAARDWPAGWVAVVATSALAVGLASWMVRRFAPHAAGSGIPHAVAVIRGELLPTAARIIPVKFAGGWLAIGSGLALGREGPTVQMGATLALLVATRLRRLRVAWPALFAAGAGAGLTVAFDAPVAGMLFVFEEVLERFERRTVMATATACIVGVVFQRAILGAGRDFVVPSVPPPAIPSLVLFLLLGVVAGILGALYNRLVLGFDRVTQRTANWPAGAKGAVVGALVGAVAWFTPPSVGSGDPITQAILAGHVAIATLPGLFLVRFVLGPLSYRAGTPGGLFAPLLVLGAAIGFACGWMGQQAWPGVAPAPVAFAVAGMAAFFTATVRSQLTGIVLVAEMTWSFSLALPMLVASAGAYAVSALLHNAPIYESLRERQAAATEPAHSSLGAA